MGQTTDPEEGKPTEASEPTDAQQPAIEASSDDHGGDSRTFSFACFPAERILVLAGLLAAPGVVLGMFLHFRATARWGEMTLGQALSAYGQARLLAGLTVLLATALVVYGIIYLQVRRVTRLTVSAGGFVHERPPVLPFGWLGRHHEHSWSELTETAFRLRWTLTGRRPELLLAWPGGRLALSVADAWEERPGAHRPWLPRRPGSRLGWRDHPLVQIVGRRLEEAGGDEDR